MSWTTRAMATLVFALCVLSAVPARAAEPCEELSTVLEAIGKESDLVERQRLALGMISEQCPGLPAYFRKVLSAVAHASPTDWPVILGRGAEEDVATWTAACPSWSKQPWAAKFSTAKPAGSAVFKACAFNRQAVVSAKEFAGPEVHLATTALVLHQALRVLDVEPALATRLVRAIIVPGELPLAPPPEPPKVIRFRDLNKR